MAACIIVIAMLLILIALVMFLTISFNPPAEEGRGGVEMGGGERDNETDGDDDVNIGSNDIGAEGGVVPVTVQHVYGSKKTIIVLSICNCVL